MTDLKTIDWSRCAMLSLDFTSDIVDVYATDGRGAAARAAALYPVMRDAGALIVHVIPGGLDAAGQPVARFGALLDCFPLGEKDLLLHKEKIGAFSTTGLDAILRSSNRDTLFIAGIATSGTVLSTTRAAFDEGYKVFIVEDCCSDPDAAVHELLTTPVHPNSWVGLWRVAEIVTAAQIIDAAKA